MDDSISSERDPAARPAGPPPPVRHRAALAASIVLILIWAAISMMAHPLSDWLRATVDRVEVAWGLNTVDEAP